jgi:hypothetical protein
MARLIVEGHDPEREFQFDLAYLMSLTTAERYQWMFARSGEAMERMIRNGHLPATEIIKRPARKIRRHRSKHASKPRLHAAHR